MRDLLIFVVGLLTGALLTAFLTPKTGTQLRGELTEAYELRMQELNQKVEQLQTQLKAERGKGKEAEQSQEQAEASASA